MAFRVNRSFSIVPGVKFRLNKRSMGLTLGKGPFHYTVNSRGRRTSSVGIPGTGMYFQEGSGGTPYRRSARSRATVPDAAPAPEPEYIQGTAADAIATSLTTRRPGLFAPKGEKALHRALATKDEAALEQIAQSGGRYTLAANALLAIVAPCEDDTGLERRARAIYTALEAGDPATDAFIAKYAPGLATMVPVTAQVSAELPMSRAGLALLYVETLQALGRLEDAANYVVGLERNEVSALSLAELWVALERWSDVVDLTTGITNTDDYTALMLVYRGIAFREQGFFDAAREAFRDALRSKKRNPMIRHLALFARSQCSVAQRRFAAARKDLETILNENPDYEGLDAALDALGPAKGAPPDSDDADDSTDDTEPTDEDEPAASPEGPPTMLS
jgi:tetratricopeptide (TPR) repeat protein